MEELKKLFKNTNFQTSIIVITVLVLTINFPFLLLFLIPLIIIACVNDEYAQSKKAAKRYEDPDLKELKNISEELQELDVEKDYSKLKNITERIPSLMEDLMTPKTFYEILGDLTLKTTHYFFEDLQKQDKM